MNLFLSTACRREKEKQNLYEVKVGESCLQSILPDPVPSGKERAQKGNREYDSVCKGK